MMHSKKQPHSQSKPCYKHLWSLGRFKTRACQGKERQHTYFCRVKPVLYNREGCCIGASKEARTIATPLRCWTRLGETAGAINTIPWPALSTTEQKLLLLIPTNSGTIVTHDLPLPKQWQVHMGLAEGQQDCNKHNHRNQANALKSIPVTRS